MASKIPVLEMRDIRKTFPGVVANDNINLQLYPGEIHALLGENGAGKTTLMKILYGLYQADSGQIIINGQTVTVRSPKDAIDKGIGMVHQHFMLIPPFTVTENIILGMEPKSGIILDLKQAVREVQSISERYGLKIDPYAKVESISLGMQQRVEILKALFREAQILILDEPTAVLTPQEVGELKLILRTLADQGKAIVFITHKLKEVCGFCDRVTVIRRGRVIGMLEKDKATIPELARMMVGRDVELTVQKSPAKPGAEVLRLEHVTALNNRRLPALRGIDLSVREGEILGVAGVEGNGQSELVEVINGLRKVTSGRILFNGKPIQNLKPRKIQSLGIYHVPEDRQKRGLILDFSIAENLVLEDYHRPPFRQGSWLNQIAIRHHAQDLVERYDIRTPNSEMPAGSLSGGNQQKVVLARELTRNPKLLVVAQPTRGLDIGAIEFVHRRLVEERDMGKAILLVSLELDEILALADRIVVMYEGQITGILSREEATEERLGLLMLGGRDDRIKEGEA